MKVSVLIVGFKNLGDIAQCLSALSQSSYTDFDVFVCENGGPESYKQLASLPTRLAGGQVVDLFEAPSNVGFAGGVNIGIRARPEADAWWILNPDTVPAATCLESLVARMTRGGCSAVGGELTNLEGHSQSVGGKWNMFFARATRLPISHILDQQNYSDRVESQLDFISGANLLVRRDLVEGIGLMREDYFLYGEEVEWCLRAKRAGFGLGFAPGGRVIHSHGSTTGAGEKLSDRPKLPVYLDERNRLHIVRDLSPIWFPVTVLLSLFILSAKFAGRGHFRQWRYAAAGWLAGIRNERGRPSWIGQ